MAFTVFVNVTGTVRIDVCTETGVVDLLVELEVDGTTDVVVKGDTVEETNVVDDPLAQGLVTVMLYVTIEIDIDLSGVIVGMLLVKVVELAIWYGVELDGTALLVVFATGNVKFVL